MKKIFIFGLMVGCLVLSAAPSRALFLEAKGETASAPAASRAPANVVYPMQTFQLNYASAKEVANMITPLMGDGESSAANEKLNMLVVRASAGTISWLSKVIQKVDQPPLQVMVKAKIIEIKSGHGDTNNSEKLGVNWQYTRPENANDYAKQMLTTSLTSESSSLGLYAQLLSGNVEAYLSALQKVVGYDLVAEPWITALNHEEAEILIGSKYGYKTSVITQTSTVQEVQYLEVGTKLKFTPHVSDDGYIRMTVAPSISEGQVVNELPQENTTETKNQVLVKDGQTIVIGGLTKNYNSEIEYGVPILANIPLLGNLFKRTEMVSEKRDIMVLITPYIITPEFLTMMSGRAGNLESKIQENLKKQIVQP